MTLIRVEHVGFHAGNGGNLHIVKGVSPSPVRIEGWGVGFGPLRISPWAGSTAVVDELTFESAENSGLFSLFANTTAMGGAGAFGAALVASHLGDDGEGFDPTDRSLTRRSLIIAAGTAALAGGSRAQTETTSSDDEGDLYDVARFQLDDSPRGINLRVDSVVADYLPPEQTFYVRVDGTNVGSFKAAEGETLTINPGITGEVTISSDTALSFIERIIARFNADDEIHYTFHPVDDEFSTFAVDDEVTITDQPILVEPLRAEGPDDALFMIGGEPIPHADTNRGTLGYWYIRDGRELVYVVGEDAPESTLVDVKVNIGAIERLQRRF